MSRPCRFEMSKHSIRTRQALEVEALAQALERLDPAQPLLLRRRRLVREREPRVLGGELGEPLLLAAGRCAHLDGGAAQLGEEARERLGVGRCPAARSAAAARSARRCSTRGRTPRARSRGPALRRSRGGTRSGRSACRRGAGRAAPPRGRPRRRARSRRPCRRPAGRRPGAARGSRSRTAGCGSASRPRSAPRRPPRASSPPAPARSSACRRRGTGSRLSICAR